MTMEFVLKSCPFCGRTLDSTEPEKYVCESCGKYVYRDRSNTLAFIRPSEVEDNFRGVFQAIENANEKRALDIASDLVETVGNADSYFVLGYVYAITGEDGKTLANWKKGMELLGDGFNLDAYICLMSDAIAKMIYLKEKDFVVFNVLAFMDNLAECIDTSTNLSCKAFLYYSVYICCANRSAMIVAEDEDDYYKDIIPLLFKRVVAYNKSPTCQIRIIREYLDYRGYNAETYEEDEKDTEHIYDLIRQYMEHETAGFSDSDRMRIFDHWTDELIQKELEPALDALLGEKKSILSLLKKRDESDQPDESNAVEDYVDRWLLIEAPSDQCAADSKQ